MAIGTLQGEEEKQFQLQIVIAKVMYTHPQVLAKLCLDTETTVLTTTEWSKSEVVLYKWGCASHSNNEASRELLLTSVVCG